MKIYGCLPLKRSVSWGVVVVFLVNQLVPSRYTFEAIAPPTAIQSPLFQPERTKPVSEVVSGTESEQYNVTISVNGVEAEGLKTPVPTGARVDILPNVSGGAPVEEKEWIEGEILLGEPWLRWIEDHLDDERMLNVLPRTEHEVYPQELVIFFLTLLGQELAGLAHNLHGYGVRALRLARSLPYQGHVQRLPRLHCSAPNP